MKCLMLCLPDLEICTHIECLSIMRLKWDHSVFPTITVVCEYRFYMGMTVIAA